MLARHRRLLLLFAGLVVLPACNGRVTRPAAPQEPIQEHHRGNAAALTDFTRNWRQMISASPDLALPVQRPDRRPAPAWQPQVVSQCVMAGSDRILAEVRVSWSEATESTPQLQLARQEAGAAPGQPPPAPRLRFDLSLHYNGLQRNYYSAALAANRNDQFRLPSTSGLVNDQASVLVTGPGLFPRLHDYIVQVVQDPARRQSIAQHTLVLRELSHGLTYTLSLDRPVANGWSEQGRVAFQTPVCPNGF
jgi:hypothetical protein